MENLCPMKILLTSLILVLSSIHFSASCQNHCAQGKQKSLKSQNGSLKSAADNLRSDTTDIISYSINLDFTQSNTISGSNKIVFTAKMAMQSISLDLLQMTIDSISHLSGNLSYSYNDTLIICDLSSALNVGQTDSITVYYHGSPQQDASGWGGFYFQGNYSYNLGVGFAADPHNYGRVWHPCFDNFAERATYDFEILSNGGKTAYCNGELISRQTVGTDSSISIWHMPDPIPSYLASVAVAPYTHAELEYASNITNDTTPIWLIAEPSDTNDFKSSFTNIQGAMEAFETFYGDHAWNKVGFALVPFNSGAMEHATNIAFPAATANGSLLYETLMAHELSHHWWGDLVTCQTEEEMWINEGMASYSEKLFLEHVYGRQNYLSEMRDNHHNVLHLAHILDSGYYALNAVPHAYTYGEHSYNKGSDVAHTMRGYFGDALFFQGLQSIITNYAGGNLSSVDFMDHLNTVPGINATDFFEDWIFSPGFSHFQVSSFAATPSAGLYDVDVVVSQKLKATTTLHDNVPLQVSFIDASWNIHHEEIMMSGAFDLFNFQIPINPVHVFVNMDERINDATTSENHTITSTGLSNMPYANTRLTIGSLTDSVFVRATHHWVYPNFTQGVPANVVISPQRYWSFRSIDAQNMSATIRFDYNGQQNNAGYYDDELFIDYGTETFVEDSIVLLYRPDKQSAWTIHPDYNIAFQGLNTDKKGAITTNVYMDGEYTFGYKTNAVSVQEPEPKAFLIYPNPGSDFINIELDKQGPFTCFIYDSNGKIVSKNQLSDSNNQIPVSQLSSGLYIVSIVQNSKSIGNETLVIKR